jgi:ribosomal protein S18 acetylase RimI-like enzyme
LNRAPQSRVAGQLKEADVIRPAVAADIEDVTTLMNSVAGFRDETWRPDVLERALGSPDTIALVHLEDEEINGFACAHGLGFRAYLSELIVSAKAQHRGIGSGLLSEIERRVVDRGCSVIVGDVWRDAEAFYHAQGWTPPSAVLLRKRLPRVPTCGAA